MREDLPCLPPRAISEPQSKPEQLAASIGRDVRLGILRAGQVLPPVREAAEKWGLSKDLVQRAYQLLIQQGVVADTGDRGRLPRYAVALAMEPWTKAERDQELAGMLAAFADAAKRDGFSNESLRAALTALGRV